MKTPGAKQINLLRRALKIAAAEAFQSEVLDTGMRPHLIGNENQYQSNRDWLNEKVENWIAEAEIESAKDASLKAVGSATS